MIPNTQSPIHFVVSPVINGNYKYTTVPIKYNFDTFMKSMSLEEPIIPMNTEKKEDKDNIFYMVGKKFGHFTKMVMNKVEEINKNQNKDLLTSFERETLNDLTEQENTVVTRKDINIKNETVNNIFSKFNISTTLTSSILQKGLIDTLKEQNKNSQKGQLAFDFGPTEEELVIERQEKSYSLGKKLGKKFNSFSKLMAKTVKDLNDSKNNTKNIQKIEPPLNTTTPAITTLSTDNTKQIEITDVIEKPQVSPIVEAQNTLNLESATGYVGLKKTESTTENKSSIKKNIDLFKSIANNLSVRVKQITDIPNNINHFFVLSGEEKNIKKLQKNHSELFKIMGFKSEDLLSNSTTKTNGFSLKDKEQDIFKFISEKFNFDSTKNSFTTLESNTQPNVKVAYLEKIVYPKLKEEIQNILTFTENLNELASKNIYLNKLNSFSEKYEFDKDAVIHLLKTNPSELKNIAKTKDFEEILKNKDAILNNYDRYQDICANHITYSKQVFNVYQTLIKEMPRNDKNGVNFLKNNNSDSYLFSKAGKGYKLQDVINNISDNYNYLKHEENEKNNIKPKM